MSTKVFHHVAVFRWVEGAAPEIDALARELTAFARTVPGLASYACGADAGIREGSDHFAVSAAFETEHALRAYLSHPAHHAITATYVSDAISTRHSVQFQSEKESAHE
jgi:heme-degrading monooxygenase HmoA